MKFKFLPHTADVKFQAFGNSIEEAFENSAIALKETICGKKKIKSKLKKEIKISGTDFESLLYKFLEEILYLVDAEDFLISKIEKIKIEKLKLIATLFGDNAKNYKFTNPVKAVTYNDMFIKKENKKWVAQVVVDV